LKEGVIENGAEGGQVIIMNPRNGDILAMADYPDFDSNHWRDSTDANRKNSNGADVYEPGSVFKLITISGVLDEGIVTTRSVINVPQTITIGGRTIREAHGRAAGETDSRTVSEILEKSLNVGTSLLAIKLGSRKFYEYIQSFGIGSRTGIELPAESRGILNHVKSWSEPDIAMISFGQGVAVTPIQMIAAAATIINNGERIKPRIVWQISQQKDRSMHAIPITSGGRAISAKTAKEMISVMHDTVEHGTATAAKIPGYRIGGKTGTAQKVRPGGWGYEPGKYVASFTGFFPVGNPEVVILVIVDSPTKSIYGATVAIPIFRKIALATIDHMNIYPDDPSGNVF
ncbi:penicillin-binding protein 2, partial [bacterium]|nr:penicillin-binding protein 2 [bacterium]